MSVAHYLDSIRKTLLHADIRVLKDFLIYIESHHLRMDHNNQSSPQMVFEDGSKVSFDRKSRVHSGSKEPAIQIDNTADIWVSNGVIHRSNDYPAITTTNGDLYWYKHGLIHGQDDEPAIIEATANGRQVYWYKWGLKHREGDYPAEITEDHVAWYKDGVLHREAAPALIKFKNGDSEFWKYGKIQDKAEKTSGKRVFSYR